MPRKRGRSDGRPALIVEMFDAGDSTDDIALELDISPHYVRGIIRAAGRELPRTYARSGARYNNDDHCNDGFFVVSDPLDIFSVGAFFPATHVKAARILGTLVPGLRLREKGTGTEFVVVGELDRKQEIVSIA